MAKSKSARYQKPCFIALGLTLLLSLLFTLPAEIRAAPDEVKWSRVNIPTGGGGGDWVLAGGSDVQHLTMAPDGTLSAYGKGLTYTLYKSTNGGYSWSAIGDVQDDIVDIAIAPDDADIIYYATSSTVYRSTDGGTSFTTLSNPGGAGSNNVKITSIAVAHLYRHIIAAATRDTDSSQFGGIYILDEEQVNPAWADTNLSGYDVYAVDFSPNYAADRQLAAVVTDETDTFVTSKIGDSGWGTVIGNAKLNKDNSAVPTPVAVANSAAIAFPDGYDATSPDQRLFIAIDTGSADGDVYRIDSAEAPGNSAATDLNAGAADSLSNVDITGLAVTGNAANARLLAGAASSARTYFSDVGGHNWTRSRKEPTGGSRTYVLMSPDFGDSGKAYAATSGTESAFSTSQDSGVIWNQIGLIDTDTSNIIDLAPSPNYSQDKTLFMLTFGGEYSLWRSLNDGANWERVFASTLSNVDALDMVKLSPLYGSSSQVVFVAGDSNGRPTTWKSTDNGQNFIPRFTFDPDSGDSFPIDTWAVVDDETLFIGSYDGSKGRVYRTTNSGFSYSNGAVVGSQPPGSMVLSPAYQQDETILIGNTNGWVYRSNDNGASFEPLPPDAGSPPLTGVITVAFDPNFSNNNNVYAASNTANSGIHRFTIGGNADWESIDSTLPAGSTLGQVIASAEGTLYAANSQADGGVERSLNPTYSLGPTFETVTSGFADGAVLSGLWQHGHQLWTVDTINNRLLTLYDSLTSPVTLISPPDTSAGLGDIINYTISDISLDWEAMSGATSYQWQLDYDTDFSSVPAGFEGTTKASSARLPALEPATTYYWRVRASQPVLSPWSPRWSFTTSLDTEANYIKLESPEAGASGMSISPLFQWSAVPGADKYELLVSTDINFANPSIVKTGPYALPTTAWQGNISLQYNTTYYWKVRALNPDTHSAWSAVGSFTTEPPPNTSAQPSAAPPVIFPVPLPQPSLAAPPASPMPPPVPPPPPSPPIQAPTTPDWVIYLVGVLLLVIILLVVSILVLVTAIKRL